MTDDIEVTPAMIQAGLEELKKPVQIVTVIPPDAHTFTAVDRVMTAIYRAMRAAAPEPMRVRGIVASQWGDCSVHNVPRERETFGVAGTRTFCPKCEAELRDRGDEQP